MGPPLHLELEANIPPHFKNPQGLPLLTYSAVAATSLSPVCTKHAFPSSFNVLLLLLVI